MEDLLKDACTHELRNLLTVWNGFKLVKATPKDYETVRLKIFKVCDILDAIERREKASNV